MIKVKHFCFNAFGENTYILYTDKGNAIIVDPGNSNPREDKVLFSYIDDNKLNPLKVINTHGHIDHIVGNYAVSQYYGIEIVAHADSKADFSMAQHQARMFGFADNIDIKQPDIFVKDGDIVSLDNETIEIIATPGHAKGSISIYLPNSNIVFTGDALFCRSIGRTDLYGGDYKELRQSIVERLFALPDDCVVMCGHSEPTSIGEEKRFNPYID